MVVIVVVSEYYRLKKRDYVTEEILRTKYSSYWLKTIIKKNIGGSNSEMVIILKESFRKILRNFNFYNIDDFDFSHYAIVKINPGVEKFE